MLRMLSLLEAIENSAPAIWVREANTVFAYPTILAVHTFGMILVVGISLIIALRTLGVAREVPIEPLKKYVPLMWIGFYVNFASGLVLFFIDGRAFATNPVFWIKMGTIVAALAVLRRLLAGLTDFSAIQDSSRRTLARALFVFWVVAVTAGRLTAYDDFIQKESAIAVLVAIVVVFLIVRYPAAGAMNFDSANHVGDGSRIDSVAHPPARV
jgi:hypothetical protein